MGMIEGDTANLKASAVGMWLEAILLEVPPSAAEVADVQQGAILDFVPRTLTPGALVTRLVACPAPWTVDNFLNVTDMSRGEG